MALSGHSEAATVALAEGSLVDKATLSQQFHLVLPILSTLVLQGVPNALYVIYLYGVTYFRPTCDSSNLPCKESPHKTGDMSPKADSD